MQTWIPDLGGSGPGSGGQVYSFPKKVESSSSDNHSCRVRGVGGGGWKHSSSEGKAEQLRWGVPPAGTRETAADLMQEPVSMCPHESGAGGQRAGHRGLPGLPASTARQLSAEIRGY